MTPSIFSCKLLSFKLSFTPDLQHGMMICRPWENTGGSYWIIQIELLRHHIATEGFAASRKKMKKVVVA
eukprot:scaffold310_cov174-Ochromonas_danica.AAC.8